MAKRRSYRSQLKVLQLLLLDVDGVLTDGGVFFAESGDEWKKFNIQDGYGIVRLQKSGVKVGIITGRFSRLVERRAKELGISETYQNLENKLEAYEAIKVKLGLTDREIAYIGDDEPDLPVMKKTAFSAAPADAVAMVRRAADYVCKRKGGEGAVREVIDLILDQRKDGER
ncbi:MAG: HAD-IIIA family hydrolase [Ignavibacteriales bacterium]|nr:HAD-IIIA family hydrolase [Ignavibacteriales bacterium]